jgi:hypothetical protein
VIHKANDAMSANRFQRRHRFSPNDRRLLLLALTLAAFAWRVYDLDAQSLWRDEVDAVYFALRDLPQTLSMFIQAGQNGVLYFLGLRPWMRVVGSSEFALRYPSAIFSTLAIPLTWQVARLLIPGRATDAPDGREGEEEGAETQSAAGGSAEERRDFSQESAALSSETVIGDDETGENKAVLSIVREAPPLLAALFMAVNSYQLWYGQEGKMYSLITMLTLLASWFWLRGISDSGGRRNWRPWLGYLITVSLAIYAHLLMIMLLPVHLLWFLIAWPQSKRHWRGYGLALAGLTLPYLPMVIWQWDLLMAGEKRTGFSFTPMQAMLEKIILSQARGFMPPTNVAWLTPIFFLGLAGLFMGFFEIGAPRPNSQPHLGSVRRYLLALIWLLAPIATIYALSLRQPIFTARYVIWIAPAAAMFMALGVQLVWRNVGKLGKVLAALLVVYTLAFWLYAGWRQKTQPIKYDLRSAVTYIAQRRSPDDLLILQIPHMEYAYRYYSSDQETHPFEGSDERLGWWVGGLWTNNGHPDEQARAEVDAQMRAIAGGADDIWVMRSEVEMWDSRHLMDEWLDEHAALLEQADYHGTQVRRYRMVEE